MENPIAQFVKAVSEKHPLGAQAATLPQAALEHFYLQSVLAASNSMCAIYDTVKGKKVFVSEALARLANKTPEEYTAEWPEFMASWILPEDAAISTAIMEESYTPFISQFKQDQPFKVMNLLIRMYPPHNANKPLWLLHQHIPFTWQGDHLTHILVYFTDVSDLPIQHTLMHYTTTLPEQHQLSFQFTSSQSAHNLQLNLSVQEYQLIKLLARGFERKDIAEALHTSTANIDRLRNGLLAKTDTPTTAALIDFGVQHGLVY